MAQLRKMRKSGRKKNKWEYVLNILSLIGFFAIWQVLANMNKTSEWFNPAFLPAPSDVVELAVEYIKDGSLFIHITTSVRRILLGFGIGTALSIVIGVIFTNCMVADALLSPIFNLLGPIPPFAFLPIIIIWFGVGEGSKVGLIVFSTFMTMLPYVTDGLRNTPPVLIRVANSLGATKLQVFTRVMIPNALPNLFVGMKVTLAMTFGAMVVAEMIGANSGLGYMIINAKTWFKMGDMFLAIILIGLIYTIFFNVIRFFEKILFSWKTDVTSAIEK